MASTRGRKGKKEGGEREGWKGGGGKERHEEKRDKASRQREKENGVRITNAMGLYKGASEWTKGKGLKEGLGRVMLSA